MRAVSLFSGCGGMDLGLERAGIETVLQCEIDPWPRKVLERHWPNTRRVNDVRSLQARGLLEPAMGRSEHSDAESGRGIVPGHVDLIHGGFPCQPFSVAGKREGDRDERNLWPEFRRVVRELRPSWVLAENVPGILSFDSGRFFGSILDDLGECGYEGVAYAVLDAQHFGVPQRRRRVFIVAGPTSRSVAQVLSLCESCGGNPAPRRTEREGTPGAIAVRTAQTGSNGWGIGVDEQAYTLDGAAQAVLANPLGSHHRRDDLDHDTYVPDTAYAIAAREAKGVSLLESQTNYVSIGGVRRLTPLECERLMGWPDDFTKYDAEGNVIPDSHRYRMIGNGVVAPVAEWIGRRMVWCAANL